MEFVLILVFGALFSGFGTLVGFGGGVFMVPMLIIAFNWPINIAVGSVLLALFPSALISTYFNYKNNTVDFIAGIALEIPTMVGTVLGAYLTAVLPVHTTEIIFAFFIIFVGYYMFTKKTEHNKKQLKSSFLYKLNRFGPGIIRKYNGRAYKISFFLSVIAGMGAGMMAGFFGIGGGFLKVPIMVNLFNIPTTVAASTGLFMITITSLTGSISHYLLGHIIFSSAAPVVSGFVLGSFIGNELNVRVNQKMLGKLIGIGLALAGFAVLINALFIKGTSS